MMKRLLWALLLIAPGAFGQSATFDTCNELATAPASGDILIIQDIDGGAAGACGSARKITAANLFQFSGPYAGSVTAADVGGDTTTFPMLATDATGTTIVGTDAGLTYNATTNALTATAFVGALTGTASGNIADPGSPTDNAIVAFDGATGTAVQERAVTIADVTGNSVTVATTAGNALAVNATAPAAANGASQAGKNITVTASNAVASLDTSGAAAGGSVTLTSGNAARLSSGNANGGNVAMTLGTGIGVGTAGKFTGVVSGGGATNGFCFDVNTSQDINLFTSDCTTASFLAVHGLRDNNSTEDFRITGSNMSVSSAGAFQISSTSASSGTADVKWQRQAAGVWKCADDTASSVRCLQGGGSGVSSATAMPLPTGRVFHVTGTTTITSITSTNFEAGVCVTLIFDGILTFTDGSNLKLAGDFNTSADDTISLCYDGSNWYETGRSVN